MIFYLLISPEIVNEQKIPDDAIRIRIIPNSNKTKDQKIKQKVKTNLQTTMYNLLKDTKNTKEAKKIINNNLNTVDKTVKNTLKNENYKINFGLNYFPEKQYKGIKYEAGYYESLVVTLGKGKGDNWWCVLFPPLCLIEADENTDIEYKSLVKEILNKYL